LELWNSIAFVSLLLFLFYLSFSCYIINTLITYVCIYIYIYSLSCIYIYISFILYIYIYMVIVIKNDSVVVNTICVVNHVRDHYHEVKFVSILLVLQLQSSRLNLKVPQMVWMGEGGL
jgi:hypothetical protein